MWEDSGSNYDWSNSIIPTTILLSVLSNCSIDDWSMLPGVPDTADIGERVEALEIALRDDPRPLS